MRLPDIHRMSSAASGGEGDHTVPPIGRLCLFLNGTDTWRQGTLRDHVCSMLEGCNDVQ